MKLHHLSHGTDNKFYSAKNNKTITVHFEIIAFLDDQPERRSINKLMLGNSIFGARYLYAVNVKSIARILPLCDTCLHKAKMDIKYISNKKSCKHCLQWNMTSNNDIVKFDPPKNYPSEMLTLDKKLLPNKLSFHKLKAAVELASKI